MQIQIAQYVFTIRDAYSPGQTIGEIEATLLNRLRGANIADLVSPAVRKQMAKVGDALLANDMIELLQAEISDLDEGYALKLPAIRPKYGTIDFVARRIALADAQRDALAKGHLLDEEEAQREVEQRLRDAGLQQRAKAEFEAEQRASKQGLESLV